MDPVATVLDALALRPDAYAEILLHGRAGMRLALVVLLLGGLSTAVGQSVVLFANRVSPRRFLASLLVQALVFTVAYTAWVVAVWFVAGTLFDRPRPFEHALTAVGLAAAPQLFGLFVLTPYLGTPIFVVLSIWTLLGSLLASALAFDLQPLAAVACAGLGWLLAQLVQRTVGRPVVLIGRRVRQAVAGAELVPRRGT